MDTNGERIISADDHMDLHVMPPRLFVDRVAASWRDQVPVVVDTDDGPCWSLDGAIVGPSGRKAKGLLSADAHGFRPGVAEDAPRGPRPRRRGGDGRVRPAVRTGVRRGPGVTRRVPPRVQRLGRRVQRRRPRPVSPCSRCCRCTRPKPRRPSCNGSPCSGTAARSSASSRPTCRRSKTSGTASGPSRDDVGIPIHFHLSGGMHSTVVRRLAAAGRGGGEPDAARRGARRHVVLRDLRTSPEREARARRVRASGGCRTSSTGSTTSSTSTANASEGRIEAEPSEYFRRHVFLTYEEDNIGLAYLDRIGAENVMWASDYPHGDSTWPNSRGRDRDRRASAPSTPTRATRSSSPTRRRLYGFPT